MNINKIEIERLRNDVERWGWIIEKSNRISNINLGKDDTYVFVCGFYIQFDEPIGVNKGLIALFESLNIKVNLL